MARVRQVAAHLLLVFFVALLFTPFYLAIVAASHDAKAMMQAPLPRLPGGELFHNIKTVLLEGVAATGGQPVWRMLLNSFIMATLIATGKIILAVFSAFSLVYFRLPGKKFFFALIFSTMMLPVEVRIVPTFQVIASFSWLNTYAGLTLPLMASATATFLFRQFFKTIPGELVDASKLDGAGPWRFFRDILLPLSKTQMAALFIILFIYGWNQYLWPLVITTDSNMATVVMGIRYLAGVADQIPQWHYIMSVALIAMLPPCLIVVMMQRWFEKGLIH
ncbi:sn-glycerol-3-phosphate ABC transporter permease UgpE [Legionella spiritensis]|uniref:sn-glycerol-3-phosphate transport system permease protein UgpE n=1 Tax=Legionella spiritensis TaxID=452 RepID=A0A0W0Z790_LEGSP|nr:sn-glycerol-3-phosphate ABC transporter permease UgpE [Legionella spiritensis]KTD64798.1 sn-glycerol-3-phosphate transmembrane ABC transporter [Legionella spiritensis]SNV39894.1 sn-glycerol 3-phosphate transport system permease protein [Legionella spiritensis]VEG90439.1 sn-glycerol 3-phosphate transport system permease protein [Legionella spiritensis]